MPSCVAQSPLTRVTGIQDALGVSAHGLAARDLRVQVASISAITTRQSAALIAQHHNVAARPLALVPRVRAITDATSQRKRFGGRERIDGRLVFSAAGEQLGAVTRGRLRTVVVKAMKGLPGVRPSRPRIRASGSGTSRPLIEAISRTQRSAPPR